MGASFATWLKTVKVISETSTKMLDKLKLALSLEWSSPKAMAPSSEDGAALGDHVASESAIWVI